MPRQKNIERFILGLFCLGASFVCWKAAYFLAVVQIEEVVEKLMAMSFFFVFFLLFLSWGVKDICKSLEGLFRR